MTRWRPCLLAAMLTMTLAACQPGPPPPTSAVTERPLETTREAVAEALRSAGLTVETSGDRIRASDGGRFAQCGAVMVGTGNDRDLFTQPSEEHAEAVVSLTSGGAGTSGGTGTRVSWETSYRGRYHHQVNNTWFERRCDGTGELETLLEAAVSG